MIDLKEYDFRKKIKRLTKERNQLLIKVEELTAENIKLKKGKKK